MIMRFQCLEAKGTSLLFGQQKLGLGPAIVILILVSM